MKPLLHLILFFVFLTNSLFSQTKGNLSPRKTEIKEKERIERLAKASGNINSADFSNQTEPVYVSREKYAELKKNGLLKNETVKPSGKKNITIINHTVSNQTLANPCAPPAYTGTALTFPDFTLPDDDGTETVALPFNFCFYGNTYTTCAVSINGNVQFGTTNSGYTATGFPSSVVNMVAPFWADVDLNGVGQVLVDIYSTKMVISWDSVGYFDTKKDKTNSFQCVITDGTDPVLPPGKNVGFYYKKMQWTTGSGGTNGFGGNAATVGVNGGNGVDYLQIGRFSQAGTTFISPTSTNNQIGWLNGKTFFFNVCPPLGSNAEPTSSLIQPCQSFTLCGNDTITIKEIFFAPEVTQTTSVTAIAPTLGSSFSYSTTNNGSSTSIFMFVNGNTATNGIHTITMTATDDGTPAQSSTKTFDIYVDQNSASNLNGSIVVTPTLGACPGGTVTATAVVTGGTPDSYFWNNNATSASTSFTAVIPADSLIFVTLTSNQCQKTIFGHININPLPVAAISGNLSYCNGTTANTILTATNTLNPATQGPHTFTWASSTGNLGSTNSETTTATGGVYTVTVTNQFGCKSTATATVTSYETPKYSITSVSNNTTFCLNQDTARLAINYGISASGAPCGLGNGACNSPTIVSVGNGTTANSTTSWPSAYGNYYKNARHQMIFTAAELLAAGVVPGKISSISFPVNSLQPVNTTSTSSSTTWIGTLPNYSIKIKCTTNSTVTSNFDNTGLNQVFFGNITPTVGINTHDFTQPYIWDGTSNLLVDICYTRNNSLSSEYYTSNPIMPYTNVGANRCVYFNSDSSPACGNPTGTTTNSRPNIKFGNCLAQQSGTQFSITVTPSVSVSVPASHDSIRIALPGTISTNCYTVSILNVAGNCVKDTVICLSQTQGITQTSLIVSSNSVCAGSSLTLSNANSVSTYTILYNNGTGVQSSVNSSVTFTPSSSVNNTYTLIAQGFCGGPITSFTNSISVLPQATLSIAPIANVTKCLTGTATLNANVSSNTPGNSGAPYTYNWTTLPGNNPAPGSNSSSSYTTSTVGTSSFVVTVNGFCTTTASTSVVVDNFNNNLQVSIIDSAAACPTSNFGLTALVTGGRPNPAFSWFILPNTAVVSNSNPSSISAPEAQGIYTVSVLVTDSCGYTAADAQVITVLPPCEIVIPNIITPNGDGANDVFKITNIEFHPNSVLTIYDRWGRKVYENQNYQNDWKGNSLSDGTYFYVLDVPKDKKYNGFITIFTGK